MSTIAHRVSFPLFIVVYELAVYLSNDAYLPALPDIARTFSTTDNVVQLTFTSWFLGYLVSQFIVGPLSEKYGRRPVLLYGSVLFVVSTLACAYSFHIVALILARFFQGITVPTLTVCAYAAVHEYFESTQAIKILALMQSVTILAPAFGPALGGAALLIMSWHWIFFIIALWAAIAAGILAFKMPETHAPEKRLETLTVKSILGTYQGLFTNSHFMRQVLCLGCLVAAIVAWQFTGAFILIDALGFTPLHYGIAQALIFGCFVISVRVVGYLVSDTNKHRFVHIGIFVGALGAVFAIAWGYLFNERVSGMIVAMMIVSGGIGLAFPVLNRLAVEASDEPMGMRMSLLSAMNMVGAIVCSMTLALFYQSTFYSLGWIMLAFLVLAYGFGCYRRTQHQ